MNTAEHAGGGDKVFVLWYNPYSGRAACHVHGYTWNAKRERWDRTLDRVFDGTHDVTVEVGGPLTVRDAKGAVVYRAKAKE